MNPSVLFVFILSALLGVLRAADLAFGTDAVTGLCLVGSVWWRYLALGIVVLAAVLVGRTQPSRSEAVRSRRPLAGVLAFAGAVCFLAAAGAQIALGAASGLGGFVRCILECVCSVWLSTMGRCWLSPDAWKKPFGGLYLAVAGSLLFYWNVLMRFMENSSSWHRVQPTAAVADAGSAGVSGGAGSGTAYPAAEQWQNTVRGRACRLCAGPVLAAAPVLCAAGRQWYGPCCDA